MADCNETSRLVSSVRQGGTAICFFENSEEWWFFTDINQLQDEHIRKSSVILLLQKDGSATVYKDKRGRVDAGKAGKGGKVHPIAWHPEHFLSDA